MEVKINVPLCMYSPAGNQHPAISLQRFSEQSNELMDCMASVVAEEGALCREPAICHYCTVAEISAPNFAAAAVCLFVNGQISVDRWTGLKIPSHETFIFCSKKVSQSLLNKC
jgi:hypothetical protein